MEEEDLYKTLGLAGPDAAQVDVRKAYRALALVWHPDKQVGKKVADVSAAAVEFEKIQKAHEVLGDEKARQAYDELWKLRKSRLEKEKHLSSKRQKMMQDLRERERAFESERSEKRDEELAAKRLAAELARIRAEHARKRTNPAALFDFLSQSQSSGQSQIGKPTTDPTPAQATEMQNTLRTTLKVSWTCTDGGAGGYTATRLKDIFEEFGAVEDVVIRESKVRRKGSALVVMSSKEASMAAADSMCGDLSNPLKVVPAVPLPSTRAEQVFSSRVTSVNVSGLANVVGSGYRSYENDVLTKMRQAAERARLVKEMQEEDAKAL